MEIEQEMSGNDNSSHGARDRSERIVLKVILFADLAQYSRLVVADEVATLAFVEHCIGLFRENCASYGGEFVKTIGDGVVIIFESAGRAVDYAISLQEKIAQLAEGQKDFGRFRIGMHMGDVRRRGDDVFGHAVNITARVQTHAKPGGVCITEQVFSAVRNRSDYSFSFAGRPRLKNLPESLSLFHVARKDEAETERSGEIIRISIIDGCALTLGNGEVVPLKSQKGRALTGYLALAEQQREQRDRMATLLWPEQHLAEARKSLAKVLRLIQKSLDRGLGEIVESQGDFLILGAQCLQIDFIDLLSGLAEGQVDERLLKRADLAESLLLGLEGTSRLFDAWLSVTRYTLHERIVEALEVLLERFNINEPQLKRAASALLLIEPSHERAARRLMRYYATMGNRAAACRVYATLEAVLRSKFDLSPSDETREIIESLAAPQRAGDSAQAGRHLTARPTVIAIGAFETDSERFGYAGTGLRAELIASLSKFREWSVIEVAETDEDIGADFILSARLSSVDDEAHLFLKMVEQASGRIAWSEAEAVSRKTWHSVKERVVGQIAAKLEIYVSRDRLTRALRRPLYDLGAYDAWLRGEHLLTYWSPETETEAEKLFEHAIAEDANFAPPYASLASIYNSRVFIWPGIHIDQADTYRALDLSQKAVELDPLDARNQMVQAWSTAVTGQYAQSEIYFELAAELNPNSPSTLISAALGLAFMGRVEVAQTLLHRALEITSLVHDFQWSHIATVYYLSGQFEATVEAAERSANVIADTPGWKAAALQQLGRDREAQAALAELLDAATENWHGPKTPSREDVLAWFLSIFPIRSNEKKAELADLLGAK